MPAERTVTIPNRTFHDSLDGTQHCRSAPVQMFFPATRADSGARKAKEICAGCPFQPDCLRYALTHDLHGVWGGATRSERIAYQRARGIRPVPVTIPSALTGVRENGNR
jgi:hypothetical protein